MNQLFLWLVCYCVGPPDATILVQPAEPCGDDMTSWADDDSLLTTMLGRINQVAGDVLLIRFVHDGLLLTLRDGPSALAAQKLSPLQVYNLIYFSDLQFPRIEKIP